VPVTINYDIIYEGEIYPMELLGESDTKESFIRILKQLFYYKRNLGKVIINYGDPISLKETIN
jgi:glycerol-3-phosphate O-acyltransferase